MLRFVSPVAVLAITVSAMPGGAHADAPMAGVVPLEAGQLAGVTGAPAASRAAVDGMAGPVRSTAWEQTDVWMSEQGVRLILDAARPMAATPVTLARR